MKNHVAANKLVRAERALQKADQICTCAGVIDEIRAAYNLIYEVGDGLWPKIIKEAREKQEGVL